MASRRNPSRGRAGRPIDTTITFNGSTGLFEYYDTEKAEKIELEELTIIPLVTKNVLSGYSADISNQIRSNYIEDVTKEPFSGFYFKDKKIIKLEKMQGLWSDIKNDVKDAGGKFSTAIISLATLDGVEKTVEFVVYNFTLGQWIEIVNNSEDDVMSSSITLTKGPLYKKGSGKQDKPVEVTAKEMKEWDEKLKKNKRAQLPITFYGLVAEITPLSDEDLEYTDEKIDKIEAYFDGIQTDANPNHKSSSKNKTSDEGEPTEDDDDDLPF